MNDQTSTAENGLRQVWCVAYDSDTPNMDGSHNAVRMHEVPSLDAVQAALRIVEERSLRAPKRNLRIETRMVSDWTRVTPPEGGRDA